MSFDVTDRLMNDTPDVRVRSTSRVRQSDGKSLRCPTSCSQRGANARLPCEPLLSLIRIPSHVERHAVVAECHERIETRSRSAQPTPADEPERNARGDMPYADLNRRLK